MTLILTYLNRFGIVQASDSNLTNANGAYAGTGRKLFAIPHLDAALVLAGSYSVAGVPMNRWMPRYIRQHSQAGNRTLADFAQNLAVDLQSQMTPAEFSGGSLVQIAGYTSQANRTYPEMWFVRNFHHINPQSGEYEQIDNRVEVTEDFWARDVPCAGLQQTFPVGGEWYYFNGFAAGRVSFAALVPTMMEYFRTVWSVPTWGFRPPNSLKETEILVKLLLSNVFALFQFSTYKAPYIGGPIQTSLIRAPVNSAI